MQAVSSSTSQYHAHSTINASALSGQSENFPSVQVKEEPADPSTSRSSLHSVVVSPRKERVDSNERITTAKAENLLRTAEDFLQRDQNVILRPDLSAFTDAQDAVDRLLPYHIWNIPHDDLLRSLGLKVDPVLSDVRARKARRLTSTATANDSTSQILECTSDIDEYGLPVELVDLPGTGFPTLAYAESLYARRSSLLNRFKRATTALNTTHMKAPVSSLSLEYLERLAYFDDREQVLEQIEYLRSMRSKLEAVESAQGLRPGTYSGQIRMDFAITQEIEREREREREMERIKRQQERAAAKAAKLDKEREMQRKLGFLPPSGFSTPQHGTPGSTYSNSPAATPGGYFSSTPTRHGSLQRIPPYTTPSGYTAGPSYGLPPTPVTLAASSRPSGSLAGVGPSTPNSSVNGASALSGLTPGPPAHRGRGRPRKHPLPGTPGGPPLESAKRKKDYVAATPPSATPYASASPAPTTSAVGSSYSVEAHSSILPPTPVGPGSMSVRPPISTMHPTLTSATSLNNPRPTTSGATTPSPARDSAAAPALLSVSAAQTAVPQPLATPADAPNAKPAIPSHPIPLLIPMTSLTSLSALEIKPVPSPHIRPVVGPDGHPSGLSGLPVPLNPNQTEAAILLGITEGTTETADGKRQQILHISVVLSKLNPTQLSGLAVLMQSLQAQVEAEKARAGHA